MEEKRPECPQCAKCPDCARYFAMDPGHAARVKALSLSLARSKIFLQSKTDMVEVRFLNPTLPTGMKLIDHTRDECCNKTYPKILPVPEVNKTGLQYLNPNATVSSSSNHSKCAMCTKCYAEDEITGRTRQYRCIVCPVKSM